MPDQPVTIIEKLPDMVVVHVQPEKIDEYNLSVLRTETAAAGAESPSLPVALDLAKVAFMPSLSLGGLIQLSQLFKSRKQRLVLVALQPNVRETLVLTRLDRLFEIHSDLSALSG